MLSEWPELELPYAMLICVYFNQLKVLVFYSGFNHETNQDQNQSTSIFDRIINYYCIEVVWSGAKCCSNQQQQQNIGKLVFMRSVCAESKWTWPIGRSNWIRSTNDWLYVVSHAVAKFVNEKLWNFVMRPKFKMSQWTRELRPFQRISPCVPSTFV